MIPGLNEAESGAVWGLLGGITVGAFLLWIHFEVPDLFNRLLRDPLAELVARARRRRLEQKVRTYLTPAGSAAIAEGAFSEAAVALFDGGSGNTGTGRQMTPWQDYDVRANRGIECPDDLTDAWIEVRAKGHTSWARWPVGAVPAGYRVALPDTSAWFTTDTRRWLT